MPSRSVPSDYGHGMQFGYHARFCRIAAEGSERRFFTRVVEGHQLRHWFLALVLVKNSDPRGDIVDAHILRLKVGYSGYASGGHGYCKFCCCPCQSR